MSQKIQKASKSGKNSLKKLALMPKKMSVFLLTLLRKTGGHVQAHPTKCQLANQVDQVVKSFLTLELHLKFMKILHSKTKNVIQIVTVADILRLVMMFLWHTKNSLMDHCNPCLNQMSISVEDLKDS